MTAHAPTRSLAYFFDMLVREGYKPRRIRAIKILLANRVLRALVTYKEYPTADRLLSLILTDNADGVVDFLDEIRRKWVNVLLRRNIERDSPCRVSDKTVQALNRAVWSDERFLVEQGRLNTDVHDLYVDWMHGSLLRIKPQYANLPVEEDAYSRFELQ